MLGFDSFETAVKTICGIEAMHKIRKGQIEEIRCVLSEVAFINKTLGVTAQYLSSYRVNCALM
jgi:hypothetical protein